MLSQKIKIRAAGFLFIEDKILLIEHKKHNSLHWVLPGGGIEFQEKAEKALQREFLEELNLTITVEKFLFADEVIWDDRHNIDLYFRVLLTGPFEVKLEQNSAVCQYGLFSKEDISSLTIKPDLKDIIQAAFDNQFYKGFKTYEN